MKKQILSEVVESINKLKRNSNEPEFHDGQYLSDLSYDDAINDVLEIIKKEINK